MRYLLPSNLDVFLRAKLKDMSHLETVKNKLIEFIGSDALPSKKDFSGKVVYTVDANYGRHYHRYIFELIKTDRSAVFVLRDFAWSHNYDLALRWSETTGAADEAFPNYTLVSKEKGNEVFAEGLVSKQAQKMVCYKGGWYSSTPTQTKVIESSKFPQLLVGPPGSGKTLVAMAILQEQALHHQQMNTGEPLRLVYVSHNPALIASFRHSWEQWQKQYLDMNKAFVYVDFFTFQELSSHHIDYFEKSNPAAEQITSINTAYVKQILSDAIQKELQTRGKKSDEFLSCFDVEMIYQELKLTAYSLLKDIDKDSLSYESSCYKALGKKQSLYQGADKPRVYSIMMNVLQGLKLDNLYYDGLSRLPQLQEEEKYDFSIFDEAQNSSLIEIAHVLEITKQGQTLFVGDSLQKGNIKTSSLPMIGHIVYNMLGQPLENTKLPSTHRLTPKNALVVNRLILLSSNLKQGIVDATAYPSMALPSATEEVEHDYIKFIEDFNEEGPKNLGGNAHSCAVVLAKADTKKAEALLGGKNVFSVYEAQGLDFDGVLLYISEETALKLSLIGNKMMSLGITSSTALREYTNNSPNKGELEGEELEIISNLIVGLSRSYGANWVYIEKPQYMRDSRGLNHFLDWFKVQITNAIDFNTQNQSQSISISVSSRQEWLERINQFILEGAIDAAIANLQSELLLSEAQAKTYVKGVSLIEDIETFRANFPSVPPLSPSQLQSQSNLAKTHTETKQQEPVTLPLQQSINSDPIQKERESKKQEPATKPSDDKCPMVTALSPKQSNYVEDFYMKPLTAKNIKSLLIHKRASDFLFSHTMENGECLFTNLIVDGKMNDFFDVINELQKKEPSTQIKERWLELFAMGYEISKDKKDNTLKLALSLCVDLSKSNVPGKLKHYTVEYILRSFREGVISHFGQLFQHMEMFGNERVAQWIYRTPQIYQKLTLSDLASQFVNEKQELGESLIQLLLKIKHSENSKLSILEKHALMASLSQTVTIPEAESFCLNTTVRLCGFINVLPLKSNSDLAEKISPDTFNAILPETAEEEAGKSAVYFLCGSPRGQGFLMSNPDLAKKISPDTFNAILPETAGKETGKSAAYFLCGSRGGRELLKSNPDLVKKIFPEALNVILPKTAGKNAGKSAAYFLCKSPEGRELLKLNPELAKKISPTTLNAISPETAGEEAGSSAVYFLCSSPGGLELLKSNPELAKKISPTTLNAILPEIAGEEAGKSASLFLCGLPEGRELLKLNPELAKKISPEALNAMLPEVAMENTDTSAVYFLCNSPEGRELLKSNPDLAKKISPDTFNAILPKTAGKEAGKSAAYFLCNSPEGGELLKSNPDLARKISPEALNAILPKTAGEDAGKSAAYFLCNSPEGRELLKSNPDLAGKISPATLSERSNSCYTPQSKRDDIKQEVNIKEEQASSSIIKSHSLLADWLLDILSIEDSAVEARKVVQQALETLYESRLSALLTKLESLSSLSSEDITSTKKNIAEQQKQECIEMLKQLFDSANIFIKDKGLLRLADGYRESLMSTALKMEMSLYQELYSHEDITSLVKVNKPIPDNAMLLTSDIQISLYRLALNNPLLRDKFLSVKLCTLGSVKERLKQIKQENKYPRYLIMSTSEQEYSEASHWVRLKVTQVDGQIQLICVDSIEPFSLIDGYHSGWRDILRQMDFNIIHTFAQKDEGWSCGYHVLAGIANDLGVMDAPQKATAADSYDQSSYISQLRDWVFELITGNPTQQLQHKKPTSEEESSQQLSAASLINQHGLMQSMSTSSDREHEVVRSSSVFSNSPD